MATPISEQITIVVRDRLNAITTASGYETTASDVVRPRRIETTRPKDYQIYVVPTGNPRNDALSHPGNPPAIAKDLTLEIRGILRQSETDSTAIDTMRLTFEADVEKAITSPANWHTMGGLAINAQTAQSVSYENDEESSYFVYELVVTYRHSEGDPYTVRA